MKKLLTTACLFVVTAFAVYFIVPAVFGQEKKTAKVSPSPAGPVAASQADGWRTIQFETTQVTAPDVAVTPDGEWLIFTMLGKLFRLSVKGGEAEQLTFGLYYDNDPAISPDGKLVAFQSDRDGSAGNIFVLTLATKEIRQLTREVWADRPNWAPDGQSLVYLRLLRALWQPYRFMPRAPAEVRQVRLAGGEPATLRTQGDVWSAFYLPDGRLGWSLLVREASSEIEAPLLDSASAPFLPSRRVTTRIEVQNNNGSVSTIRTFRGMVDPVVPSPKADGFYVRSDADARHDVMFSPISDDVPRRIFPVSGEHAGFAVSADNGKMYLGNLGHLWKVALPGGQREAVPFRAKVTLEIRQSTAPPKWSPPPGTTSSLRTFGQPELSPDGSRIVFQALGDLWEQPMRVGQARRLVMGEGNKSDYAFSPDWRELAFVFRSQGKREVQILDFESGKTRTVAPPTECGYEQLNWSLHGKLIAATACDHDILAIDPVAATMSVLLPKTKTSGWETFPELSADGKILHFHANLTGTDPALYRLRLEPDAKPEPIAPAIRDGLKMKMHGQWLAHPIPNGGIHLSALDRRNGAPSKSRTVSEADGYEFSFTPDGTALLYVAGNKLWRSPLKGGSPQEIPIRVEIQAPVTPPMLLERVRVLDFATGGFGAETGLLLENGRIRWIGPAKSRVLPVGTVTIDAAGRFAIPGLFDMHGHGGGCGGPANVSYGVTSVRNMGGRLDQQNAYADRSDFTADAIPRCYYAGRILEGSQGRNEDSLGKLHPTNEEDARMFVRRAKEQGVHFIKLYSRLPWPLQRAAADEARALGLPVVAHGITHEEVVKGVTLGFAGFTHWGSGWPHWWSSSSFFMPTHCKCLRRRAIRGNQPWALPLPEATKYRFAMTRRVSGALESASRLCRTIR